MKTIKIRITLLEEMLGMTAANKNVFEDFIASKAPDDDKRREELETAEHREEAGSTVFPRMNGVPGMWDYQIKGMFKDACGALRRCDETKSKDFKAYKTHIDGVLFPSPRFIPIKLPEGATIGVCERPLRADTAQGPRVSLCRSETVPAGSTIEFEVTMLADKMLPLIREWLDYGKFRGLGQWRNSGKGRYTWEELA